MLSPIPSTTTGVRLWSFTFGHQFVLTRRRLRFLLVVDCIDVGRPDESALPLQPSNEAFARGAGEITTKQRIGDIMKDVQWLIRSLVLATINCQVLEPRPNPLEDVEERSILEHLPMSQLKLNLEPPVEEDPRRRTFQGSGRLTSYVRGVLQNFQGLLQAPVRGIFRPPQRGVPRPRKKPSVKPQTSTKPESAQQSIEILPEKEEHQIFQVGFVSPLSNHDATSPYCRAVLIKPFIKIP